MNVRNIVIAPIMLGVIVAFGLSSDAWAAKERIPFADVQIFFEENATDGDLGIQFFFDGEGWDRVKITTPDGRRMVDIKVRGKARTIGLTEVFSESEEPSFDELPRDEFLALFPEGMYRFVGRTIERDLLVGAAMLTHTMPAAPEITSPEEDEVVDPNAMVVRWDSVPDPNPPTSVIVGYHVIVEKDEEGEPAVAVTADMPAASTSLSVSPQFLEPGMGYKVEIIAIETSGNRTITEVSFETAEP